MRAPLVSEARSSLVSPADILSLTMKSSKPAARLSFNLNNNLFNVNWNDKN